MKPGRLIADYIKTPKIEFQERLLKKLEEKGFEVEGKYILTSKKNGIPITILILLLSESYENFITETDSIKVMENEITETFDQVQSKFPVQFKDNCSKEDIAFFSSINYTNKIVLKSNITSASGTSDYKSVNIIVPNAQPRSSLNDFFSSSHSDYEVMDNFILKKETKSEIINIFQLYKHTIHFLELSYAIHERIIKSEVKNFNNLLMKNIVVPELPAPYKTVLSNRGDVIHGVGFDIYFNDVTNDPMIFSGIDLKNKIIKSYHSSFKWINEVYEKMYLDA